jgi:hypothetical protein
MKLSFVPSTGILTAGGFSGPLTGTVTGNVSGTAANVTGVVAIANGGTGTATGAPQNFIFAGPSTGGNGAPSFRALVGADLPGGSGAYIANSTTQQASSNFNISGNATIGTNQLVGGTLGVTGATTLGVLTAGATTLGATTATSVNKITVTPPSGSAVLTLANGSSFITSGGFSTTLTSTATTNLTLPTAGTLAVTSNNLGVFAQTTSAQLAGIISDETGTGALVFNTSPSFTTPVLGAATATSIVASGDITANSDRRLKKNIRTLPCVSESLRKIDAVEFDRIDINKHQIGFIAQNVQKYFPYLVNTAKDSMATLSLNYQSMTSPLLKGWQEHDEIIIKQQKEIAVLKKELESLKLAQEELKKLINSKR